MASSSTPSDGSGSYVAVESDGVISIESDQGDSVSAVSKAASQRAFEQENAKLRAEVEALKSLAESIKKEHLELKQAVDAVKSEAASAVTRLRSNAAPKKAGRAESSADAERRRQESVIAGLCAKLKDESKQKRVQNFFQIFHVLFEETKKQECTTLVCWLVNEGLEMIYDRLLAMPFTMVRRKWKKSLRTILENMRHVPNEGQSQTFFLKKLVLVIKASEICRWGSIAHLVELNAWVKNYFLKADSTRITIPTTVQLGFESLMVLILLIGKHLKHEPYLYVILRILHEAGLRFSDIEDIKDCNLTESLIRLLVWCDSGNNSVRTKQMVLLCTISIADRAPDHFAEGLQEAGWEAVEEVRKIFSTDPIAIALRGHTKVTEISLAVRSSLMSSSA